MLQHSPAAHRARPHPTGRRFKAEPEAASPGKLEGQFFLWTAGSWVPTTAFLWIQVGPWGRDRKLLQPRAKSEWVPFVCKYTAPPRAELDGCLPVCWPAVAAPSAWGQGQREAECRGRMLRRGETASSFPLPGVFQSRNIFPSCSSLPRAHLQPQPLPYVVLRPQTSESYPPGLESQHCYLLTVKSGASCTILTFFIFKMGSPHLPHCIVVWTSEVLKEPVAWYSYYCAFWGCRVSASCVKFVREEKQTPWWANSACLSLNGLWAMPTTGHCPDSHTSPMIASFLVPLRNSHVATDLCLSTKMQTLAKGEGDTPLSAPCLYPREEGWSSKCGGPRMGGSLFCKIPAKVNRTRTYQWPSSLFYKWKSCFPK